MDSLTDAVIHGKYRIGHALGEGGMGAVYLAEHIGIGRQVAVKVVRPELLADATAAERFPAKHARPVVCSTGMW